MPRLAVINDKSINAQTRAVIRYGLETNDPWLPELVRCVDAGDSIIDNLYVRSNEEKIKTLTDLICRGGDEPSAALLVLLATLENSTHPKALANTAKHFAFTRCSELNVYSMVDAQVAMLEKELVGGHHACVLIALQGCRFPPPARATYFANESEMRF